jgi:phosphatidylserine/phosphatidylglycerophosphate/cardiolipin synthase-like enzyme
MLRSAQAASASLDVAAWNSKYVGAGTCPWPVVSEADERVLRKEFGFAPSPTCSVRLISSYEEHLRLVEGMIRGAARTIRIMSCYFFANEAPFVRVVRDLLPAAAARGVKVRLLLDALPAQSAVAKAEMWGPLTRFAQGAAERAAFTRFYGETLPEAIRGVGVPGGFKVAFFKAKDAVTGHDIKSHVKMFAVDGRLAIVGGSNMLPTMATGGYDCDVLLDGAAARDADEKFVDAWREQTGEELPPSAKTRPSLKTTTTTTTTHAAPTSSADASSSSSSIVPAAVAAGEAAIARAKMAGVLDHSSSSESEESSESESESAEEDVDVDVDVSFDSDDGAADEPCDDSPQSSAHPMEKSLTLQWHERGVRFAPVMSRPGSGGEDAVLRAVIGMIDAAKEEFLVSMGFSALHTPLVAALTRASRRGVRVRVLLNSHFSCDLRPPMSDLVAGARALLIAAPTAEVYMTGPRRAWDVRDEERDGVVPPFTPRYDLKAYDEGSGDPPYKFPFTFIHAKYCVADRSKCSVGSWNAWARSAFHEAEMNVMIESEELGEALAEKWGKAARAHAARIPRAESLTPGVGAFAPRGCYLCVPFGKFTADAVARATTGTLPLAEMS